MMEENGFSSYLDEIGRGDLLSDAEERQLSERILKGDNRALNKLVEANLRFVVKVAQQYRGKGVELEDLVSEGNLGLMKAAAKFDAKKGTRFVNYAVAYVREQMERAVRQQASPDSTQVGKGSSGSVSPHQVGHGKGILSVDAPLGHRTDMSLLSVLVNRNAPMADERVYSEAIERAVEYALQTLDERESHVVQAFFGLDREHETLAEIAEDMGIRRERVRQIRDRAVRRLKKAYRHRLAELRQPA